MEGLPISNVQPPRFTLFVLLLGVDYVAGSHRSLRPMRRQIGRVETMCLTFLFCSCYWDKRVGLWCILCFFLWGKSLGGIRAL